MTALEELRSAYIQRDRSARVWKQQGGRVVGYLCDNVPEELVIAAGALPYRVSGNPNAGHAAIERFVQPFAAPFSARNRGTGFVDAMLEMLLAGDYDFLDVLVIPHTRKAIQAYYRELTLARDHHPGLQLPELWYLDRAYTPFYAAEVFNRDQVLVFKTQLEAWSGSSIAPAALVEATSVVQENKRLLQQVAALRTTDPPGLRGVDALAAIGTSHWLPRPEHSGLLRSLLREPPPPVAENTVRLFVAGSPLDHAQLYEVIESCGAVVVAEDHCWGNRCAEGPLDGLLDPLEALADRYHRRSACSIAFPMASVVQRCLARAAAAHVDGAVFFVYEGDAVHVWDTPDERRALEAHGIRTLHLGQQPYWITDVESVRRKIAAFINSLRAAAVTP